MHWRKRILVVSLASLAVYGLLITLPDSDPADAARVAQMNVMRQIVEKLRRFDEEHEGPKRAALYGRTITQLVDAQILAQADADYLREHQVLFFGYDPFDKNRHARVLEADFPPEAPVSVITVGKDGIGFVQAWKPPKTPAK